MKRPTKTRSCEGKKRHASKTAARVHMYALITKGAALLNVYKCRYCKAWHVGHIRRYRK